MSEAPGPLIAAGRAADVFDIGGGRVLRRYRDGRGDVTLEARLMRHLADRGFPVPAVHDASGHDIVMDRIEGPTMLEALGAAPWAMVWRARQLAQLQRRLGRHRAPDWLLADTADASRSHSILHLDLHPMNVILSSDGPVVIDWTNAAGGPAGFDAALTHVVLSTAVLTSTRDRVGQRLFTSSFRRFRGPRLIDPYLEAACDHRLADRNLLPDERDAVAALRRRVRGRGGGRDSR